MAHAQGRGSRSQGVCAFVCAFASHALSPPGSISYSSPLSASATEPPSRTGSLAPTSTPAASLSRTTPATLSAFPIPTATASLPAAWTATPSRNTSATLLPTASASELLTGTLSGPITATLSDQPEYSWQFVGPVPSAGQSFSISFEPLPGFVLGPRESYMFIPVAPGRGRGQRLVGDKWHQLQPGGRKLLFDPNIEGEYLPSVEACYAANTSEVYSMLNADLARLPETIAVPALGMEAGVYQLCYTAGIPFVTLQHPIPIRGAVEVQALQGPPDSTLEDASWAPVAGTV